MTSPLQTLTVGRHKFCLGRWLGMASFGEIERTYIDDVDAPESGTPHERELAVEAERKAAQVFLFAATNTALTDDARTPEAFLDDLVETVLGSTPGSPSNSHGAALERRVAMHRTTPLDPFEAAFVAARQVASRFYEDEGHPVGEEPLRCQLSLDPGHAVHGLGGGAEIGGSLKTTAADAVVTLKLSATQLWRPEMCAVTYAMLHELVVHAFAASHARESDDGFTEGWMDFVAFELHAQLASGRLAHSPPLATDLPAIEQREEARLLHDTRPRRSTSGATIKRCREAAAGAQTTLERAFGDEGGRKRMWAFSAALNRSELSSTDRAGACEQIRRAVRWGDARVLDKWSGTADAVFEADRVEDKVQIARDLARELIAT